jgi:triosephosphate isomerase
MKFIAAGNWKMHKTPEEAKAFFENFSDSGDDDILSLFFVPALVAESTARALKGTKSQWGPENIYWESQGAFTGENSPAVVRAMGASFALVGHSERRSLFHESNAETQKKIQAAITHGLTPMLCIGETLAERKAGRTLEVLKAQLSEGLAGIEVTTGLHIAYEPVWAIGTGEVASVAQVSEAHQNIRSFLKERFPNQQQDMCILYGGSVKPSNAAELSRAKEVSGFLVGGASLEADSFQQIIQAVRG